MNGIIVVNKPSGVTSRDIVNDICHIFNTKSVGHTGTLDPIASGVLIITIGKYTKLGDDLTSSYKTYKATLELGKTSDTYDTEGKVIESNVQIPLEEIIMDVINSFVGNYDQEVPIYSSVKVNGKKLYDYARNGENVELPKRNVHIKSINDIKINNNIVKFTCCVSKGTYIRSLINDIGNKLKCGAIMTSLVRLSQCGFTLNDAYTIDDIKNNNFKLLSVEDVLNCEVVEASDKLYKMISNGVKIEFNTSKEYILFKYNNKDISLYKKENDKYVMHIYLEK